MENETTVTLNIYDCKKDISKILNIQPSIIHNKNDLISKKGTIKYKNNIWVYKISSNNIIHIESLLNDIMYVFKECKNELRGLAKEHEIEISIASYIRKGMPSFHFSNKFIQFINEINSEVDIDLYCMQHE